MLFMSLLALDSGRSHFNLKREIIGLYFRNFKKINQWECLKFDLFFDIDKFDKF